MTGQGDDASGTAFQAKFGHSRGKVGHCPFCRGDRAELWYEPDPDGWKPFQVRCFKCGACGPWADCGWESAVPAWRQVGRLPPHADPERVADDLLLEMEAALREEPDEGRVSPSGSAGASVARESHPRLVGSSTS